MILIQPQAHQPIPAQGGNMIGPIQTEMEMEMEMEMGMEMGMVVETRLLGL